MRRIHIAVLIAVLPAMVLAGATWTADTSSALGTSTGRKATSTTGTETAPTSATAGISLKGANAIDVYVEAISGNMTAAHLHPYFYNPSSGVWSRSFEPDFTLSTSAVSSQAYHGLPMHPSASRFSLEPSGLGTTVTMYLQVR
jgi:hypothetical protein